MERSEQSLKQSVAGLLFFPPLSFFTTTLRKSIGNWRRAKKCAAFHFLFFWPLTAHFDVCYRSGMNGKWCWNESESVGGRRGRGWINKQVKADITFIKKNSTQKTKLPPHSKNGGQESSEAWRVKPRRPCMLTQSRCFNQTVQWERRRGRGKRTGKKKKCGSHSSNPVQGAKSSTYTRTNKSLSYPRLEWGNTLARDIFHSAPHYPGKIGWSAAQSECKRFS